MFAGTAKTIVAIITDQQADMLSCCNLMRKPPAMDSLVVMCFAQKGYCANQFVSRREHEDVYRGHAQPDRDADICCRRKTKEQDR